MREHLDTHANTQLTCCVTSASDMSMTDNVPQHLHRLESKQTGLRSAINREQYVLRIKYK